MVALAKSKCLGDIGTHSEFGADEYIVRPGVECVARETGRGKRYLCIRGEVEDEPDPDRPKATKRYLRIWNREVQDVPGIPLSIHLDEADELVERSWFQLNRWALSTPHELGEPSRQCPRGASPADVLRAVSEPPYPDPADVDYLLQLIDEAKIPVRTDGVFDADG